jgi:hypothetical protein
MRRKRRTSQQVMAKSVSIKGAKRKFGGCAWKAVKLTSGDLSAVSETGLRKPGGFLTGGQKSAEGIVGVGSRPARSRHWPERAETVRDRKAGNAAAKARTEGKGK